MSAMEQTGIDVVTGAFSYTGKYVARLLLDRGRAVKTITGHPDRPNPFGDRVKAEPFNFDNPAALTESLRGAETLYNTYWIRFTKDGMTFDKAVENSRILIKAAKEAGIARIVHISITNPAVDSSLPYFRGKALVEQALTDAGLSYATLRPTVIFGPEGILINNIAWLLRHFPVFAVPGRGDYKLQPVFVEDVAQLAVDAGGECEELVMDAAGPEIYSFDQLVRLIAETIHSRARIIHMNPARALSLSKLAGRLLKDVVLTREEVEGLMANLLVSRSPPAGWTKLSEWLTQNADTVGTQYFSELERHFR